MVQNDGLVLSHPSSLLAALMKRRDGRLLSCRGTLASRSASPISDLEPNSRRVRSSHTDHTPAETVKLRAQEVGNRKGFPRQLRARKRGPWFGVHRCASGLIGPRRSSWNTMPDKAVENAERQLGANPAVLLRFPQTPAAVSALCRPCGMQHFLLHVLGCGGETVSISLLQHRALACRPLITLWMFGGNPYSPIP